MNHKILIAMGGVALGLYASAATPVVWVGGSSGNLSEVSNWDPQVVPHGNYVAVFTNATALTYDYPSVRDWSLAGITVTGAFTVQIIGDKIAVFANSACATGGFVVDVAAGGVLDATQGYFYAEKYDFVKTGDGTFKAGRRFGYSTTHYIGTLDVQGGTLEDLSTAGSVRASENICIRSNAVLKCSENCISTSGVSPCVVVENGGVFNGNAASHKMLGIQGDGRIANVDTLTIVPVHSGLVFSGRISANALVVTNSAAIAEGASVIFGSDDTLLGVKALAISRDETYPIPDVRFVAGIGEFLIGGGTWPANRTFVDLDGMPVTFWRTGTVLYVDDDNYGKSGDGKTPATAYGTLREALEGAASYTLVRVLPGVYDKGEMTGANDQTPSRAVLPQRVRMVSVGSPEETVIKGSRSTGASSDSLGNGPGGVRCVRMMANSTMRGFTLTDGHVAVTTWTSGDYGPYGGGVTASSQGSVISDCIITNNTAVYGAAGDNGSFVRCLVLDNHTLRNDGIAFYGVANLYGCVVDRNATASGQCAYYSYYPSDDAPSVEIRNCTFGPNEAFSINAAQRVEGQRALICNSVILGGIADASKPTGRYRNCILACYNAGKVDADADCIVRTDLETTADKLAFAGLDAGLRPSKGSILIDRGTNAYFDPVSDATSKRYGGTDIAGSTRVCNGTIDIGGFEYYWGREYADLIGMSNEMSIVYMSAGVITNAEGAVCLQNQDALKAAAIKPGKYSLFASVAGDGVLSVFVNDSATAQVVSALDGTAEIPIVVKSSPVVVRLSFDGSGHGELLCVGYCPLAGFMLILR